MNRIIYVGHVCHASVFHHLSLTLISVDPTMCIGSPVPLQRLLWPGDAVACNNQFSGYCVPAKSNVLRGLYGCSAIIESRTMWGSRRGSQIITMSSLFTVFSPVIERNRPILRIILPSSASKVMSFSKIFLFPQTPAHHYR